jgi:hypothetical protein
MDTLEQCPGMALKWPQKADLEELCHCCLRQFQPCCGVHHLWCACSVFYTPHTHHARKKCPGSRLHSIKYILTLFWYVVVENSDQKITGSCVLGWMNPSRTCGRSKGNKEVYYRWRGRGLQVCSLPGGVEEPQVVGKESDFCFKEFFLYHP